MHDLLAEHRKTLSSGPAGSKRVSLQPVRTPVTGMLEWKLLQVLHMAQGNPKHKQRPDGEWIEGSPDKKHWGMLADQELDTT